MSWIRNRLADERGFTILEVLAAMLVLAIGIFSTSSVFNGSRRLTNNGDKQQVAAHVAQQEIESILAGNSFANIGMTPAGATLTQSANANDPDARVASTPANGYLWDGGTTPETWCDANNGCTGGTVAHGPTNWNSGNYSGTVTRYVSWVDDTTITGSTDYKRITIAVTVSGVDAPAKPIYVSTLVSNPS